MKHLSTYLHDLSPANRLAGLALIAAFAGSPALAQADADTSPREPDTPGDSMSLSGVLEVAVRQKPSLEQAAIDIEIAEAAMFQTLGLDDWIFAASGTWSSTRLQAFNLDQDQVTFDANLSRRLSTGGTVSVLVETGYTRATRSDELLGSFTTNTYSHTVSAALSQPLLRGRGKRIAYAQRRRTAISRDAAVLAHRVEAIATVQQVVRAYWELAYAWRDLAIRKSSLALSQERLRNTEAGIEAGAVAPTEALSVEQDIVAREQSILSAEQVVSQRSLTLRRLAGLEIGRDAIDLHAFAPMTLPERTFDVDVLLTDALAASPTIAQLETLKKDARLDLELSDNGLLPELDLVLSFGPQGSDDDPGSAFVNMVKFDDLSISASLTYRRSLSQRNAHGARASAHARVRRQSIGIEDAKAQVMSSLVLAVRGAEAAKKRFGLGARAIELAKQNVEAEKARFELGRSTNFQVLQRQDQLEQAQLAQARSLIDFLNTIAEVDSLTGAILDTYGIKIERERR